jgi:hypothetical protein
MKLQCVCAIPGLAVIRMVSCFEFLKLPHVGSMCMGLRDSVHPLLLL